MEGSHFLPCHADLCCFSKLPDNKLQALSSVATPVAKKGKIESTL
jgi:hypothetical protein